MPANLGFRGLIFRISKNPYRKQSKPSPKRYTAGRSATTLAA